MGEQGTDCKLSGIKNRLIIFLLIVLLFPVSVFAGEATEKTVDQTQEKKAVEFDAGKVIIEHILDAYDWHLADYGDVHISIPLPVILLYEGTWHFFFSHKFHHGKYAYNGFRIATEGIKKGKIIRVLDDGITPDPNASFLLDLSLTKNAASLIITSVLLCLLMISVAKNYKKFGSHSPPRGLASFLEPIVLFVRDDIAKTAIPEKKVNTFLPYLLTLFSFIFLNNLVGIVPLFPGGANVTGNISVTLALAMFTFFTWHIFANREYWKHIFNTPGVPVFLKLPIPLMPIIEIVGVIIKPLILALRLFANITAGHMVILGFASLIFVLGATVASMGFAISPLSVLFVIFMNFLELLVAFVQAYIFTFFSAIFIGMGVPEEHH